MALKSTLPLLIVENIEKNYGKLNVLNGINLEVYGNESVCILGMSGTGKSTFLNVVSGLLKPDRGRILIKQQNLYENGRTIDRGNLIGYIFQNFEMLDHMSVLENVMITRLLVTPNEKDAIVDSSNLLKKVGLEKQMRKFPYQLSSGQKQRLGIVRALINDPSIIIADEPTGSLDIRNSQNVMKMLLASSKQDRGVLYSTHDIDIAKFADKIYILKKGKLHDVEKSKLNKISKIYDLYTNPE